MGRPCRKRKKSSGSPPAAPLRRSARLSGVQCSSPEAVEVAARTSTEGFLSPSIESPAEGASEHPYEMELAITPPRRIAAGVKLELPLVVTFRPSLVRRHVRGGREVSDFSGVWAFVSLMTEDRRESLAPPQKDLLRGHVSDSIHPLEQGEATEGQPFAYAKFPELAITTPGRYCFKVNVIDMNHFRFEEARSSNAKVLPALHSHVFDVVEDDRHSGQDDRLGETMNHLRAIGANV